ncbi:MAG: thiosulfate oxidation carrier complex protein SoxZ [Rhodocyclaceae bacterium]|nr:thiosulfate oxidation carrier complex protein SoxZ [Rhodocyclaceae bacterium]MBX3667554.1 thiosulfate oxidation carrier complex protein SoxZ [Rhodocyclaceae bacterium]
MADPMKIRARLAGDVADLRVLMAHPMETGQRKDARSGQPIPPHFIQKFSIALNGTHVLEAQTGMAVSRNPVFGFKLAGIKAGDKFTITWTDNHGETRSDETVVA